MAKNNSNDSLEQKLAKEQNKNTNNRTINGDKHLDGPNHPST